MSKLITTICLGLALLCCAGCSDAGANLAERQWETWRKISTLLSTINDSTTLHIALPELEAAFAELRAEEQEFAALDLTTENLFALKQKHAADLDQFLLKLSAEAARIDRLKLPEAEHQELAALITGTTKQIK